MLICRGSKGVEADEVDASVLWKHWKGSLSQLNISRRYWSGSLKHYLLLSAVCYWLEHFVGLFHCALYILISCLFIPTASRRQYWKQINNSTCNSFYVYTGFSVICGCIRSYWSQQEHCIQSQSNCGQCKYADNRILLQIHKVSIKCQIVKTIVHVHLHRYPTDNTDTCWIISISLLVSECQLFKSKWIYHVWWWPLLWM